MPKKAIRIYGFLLAQTYTNIVFKALPRNITFTNKAAPVRRNIPNRKKKTKSAVLPLKVQ